MTWCEIFPMSLPIKYLEGRRTPRAHLLKKIAWLLPRIFDGTPPTVHDNINEVAWTVTRSSSLSGLEAYPSQEEAVDATRIALQRAYYHAGVINLAIWKGARYSWYSVSGLHQLDSRPKKQCKRQGINNSKSYWPCPTHFKSQFLILGLLGTFRFRYQIQVLLQEMFIIWPDDASPSVRVSPGGICFFQVVCYLYSVQPSLLLPIALEAALSVSF